MIPVNKTIALRVGGKAYLGRVEPTVGPAWMAGKPLNEWVAIPNTSGADGAAIDAYSGFALKQSTAEILIALAGGHTDSYDTRVSSISLLDDAPAWKSPRRKDSITSADANFSSGALIYPYCKDGVTPSSRHTRYQSLYSPFNDRIMLLGSPSLYASGGESSVASNGFSLATNTWDAPGTWPDVKDTANYGTAIDDLGNIWCQTQKWIRSTNTFVNYTASGIGTVCAFDPVRRQLFSMMYGNGAGYTLSGQSAMQWNMLTVSEDLSLVRQITINPSAAWTELTALNSTYSALTYDKDKGVFYYYYASNPGIVYVITPNAGTAWDVSKITPTGTPPSGGPTNGSGIQNRFQYVEALKGIVMLPKSTSNLYLMKTS